jgi:hypothetical protein
MTNPAVQPPTLGAAATILGAATERLFAQAFADAATINLKTAAALIGSNPKTLRKMTDDGLIRAVRRGQCRSYTEADLRAYLTEGPDVCPRDKKPSSTVRSDKIVPFSRRRR